MCGIAGIVGDLPNKHIIESMIDMMNHRGPDARGFYYSEQLHFGHCRLSINDLSEMGNQPFVDKKQKVAVIVNGEIYNFKELKNTLVVDGYKFKSRSDSEVVLHGYIDEGIEFIKKLNGMFAIAIWDGKKETLFLTRDRLGIKPLYYTNVNNTFLFASEIKALAQFNDIDLSLDNQSFVEYLAFENYFSNRTLNRNVKMVEPGEIVQFTLGILTLDRKYFWKPVFEKASIDPEVDIYKEYERIIKSSIKRHLISDVPVGFYLSSGIDTSSVVYYSSKFLGKSLNTYTGYFGLHGFYDEATSAEKIAKGFGCHNSKISIEPKDFIDNIENVLWHLDEPRVGMGSFSQYMVAKRAARDVKVILTGHGGDEFFAGYPVFKAVYGKQKALKLIRNSSFRELMFAFYFVVYPILRREAAYFLPNIFPIRSLVQLLKPEFRNLIDKTDVFQELAALKQECNNEYERLTMTYLRYYLPALFTVEDKISMAFSLESRTPLCDNEMLDFALSLPLSMKLLKYELKHIPRTAMKEKLPSFVFKLPKRGFPTPLRLWFKKDLKKFIQEYIIDNISTLTMFDVNKVKKIVFDYTNSKIITPIDEITAHRVWILLNLIIYFINQRRRYRCI